MSTSISRSILRRRIAAVAVATALTLVFFTPPPAATEAAFVDAEFASGSLTALTVMPPHSTASCVLTPGVLGLSPEIVVKWKFDNSNPTYTYQANAEFGKQTGGILLPLTSALLGYVSTTGTPAAGYTTTIAQGLLGGLLGGEIKAGIRTKHSSGWTSTWMTIHATMGLAGINPTCVIGTAP